MAGRVGARLGRGWGAVGCGWAWLGAERVIGEGDVGRVNFDQVFLARSFFVQVIFIR